MKNPDPHPMTKEQAWRLAADVMALEPKPSLFARIRVWFVNLLNGWRMRGEA